MMNTAHIVAKNSIVLIFSSILSNLSGFAVLAYLARILGPNDFGKLTFALSIIAFFNLVADMGLPVVGTSEIAKSRTNTPKYIGRVLTTRLCLSLCGLCLFIPITSLLDKSVDVKSLLVIFSIGIIPFSLSLDWVFQGFGKMEYIAANRIAVNLTYMAFVLCFINKPGDLLLIPAIYVTNSFVITLIFYYVIARKTYRPEFTLDIADSIKLIKNAFPVGLSFFMSLIYYKADSIMLGFMKTDDEVGYYNAAYSLILAIIVIAGSYHDAIFPVLSKHYITSIESFKNLATVTQKVMVTLVIPLVVGGIILARPIINLFFGHKYLKAIPAFQLLLLMVAIVWIAIGYSRILLASDNQIAYARVTTIIATINLTLNFILIPYFGLIGAATATVLAEGVGAIFWYRESSKIIDISVTKIYCLPLLASVPMSLLVYFGNKMSFHLLIIIPAGIIIYFTVLYLSKGITVEEINSIINILKREKNN